MKIRKWHLTPYFLLLFFIFSNLIRKHYEYFQLDRFYYVIVPKTLSYGTVWFQKVQTLLCRCLQLIGARISGDWMLMNLIQIILIKKSVQNGIHSLSWLSVMDRETVLDDDLPPFRLKSFCPKCWENTASQHIWAWKIWSSDLKSLPNLSMVSMSKSKNVICNFI